MTELKNEHDFECFLLKKYSTRFGSNLFPLVKSIGGERISPEIDLLNIERKVKREDTLITGYEFKFLNCKTADASYRRIHQGIGQALMYFQYGIDRCYVVIGISKNLNQKVKVKVLEKCETLRTLMKNLEILPQKPMDYMGMWIFSEEVEEQREGFQTVEVQGRFPDFPVSNADSKTYTFRQNRNNLIDNRLRYSSSFVKKMWTSSSWKNDIYFLIIRRNNN